MCQQSNIALFLQNVHTKHKGGSFVFFSDAVLFSIAKIRVHLVNLGATLKQFGRVNTI